MAASNSRYLAEFAPVGPVGDTPSGTLTLSGSISEGHGFSETPIRSASGSLVAVATGGTVGTANAHKAFPTLVRMGNGDLRVFYRRGTSHASFDGSLVSRTSSDGGVTWSSESVLFAATGTYEYRQAVPRVLSSGRLAVALYRRDTSGHLFAEYAYSDDDGATWSVPVNVTNGFAANAAVGDDVIELPSGRLIMSMYGSSTFPTTSFTIRTSYSDDGGATWIAQAQPAGLIGGFNSVESTMQLLDDGSIYLTFHTEDGVPTDIYFARSADGGATWDTPTLLFDETSYNRNAACRSPDGDIIQAYSNNTNSVVRQSFSRGAAPYTVALAVDSGHSLTGGCWATPAVISAAPATANVGVVSSWENGAQTQASVYFRVLSSAAMFAGVTLSGSSTETKGYADSPSGSVALSGSLSEARNYVDSPSGTLTVSGPLLEVKRCADNPAGALALSGSLNEGHALSFVDSPSGAVSLSGSVDERYGVAYWDSLVGTVGLSGSLAEGLVHSPARSGLLTFAGTLNESTVSSDSPTGVVALAGAISERIRQRGTGYTDAVVGIVEVDAPVVGIITAPSGRY